MHELTYLRGTEAAFPAEEFAKRQAQARHRIKDAGHEALVVTGPESIYWLTGRQTAGYFAFQALILPVEGAPVLLVRQLELPGAIANTWLTDIVAYQDGENPAQILASTLARLGIARPAIEKAGWFVSSNLMAEVETAIGAGVLSDGSPLVAPLRMRKSPAELDMIRLAAGYAQAGLTAGLATCRSGACENEVAAAMLAAAVSAGSETFGMEPLVSSGPRSGLPHMTWRRRLMEDGDAVFLEMAGSHARYHSALMRMAFIGPVPAEVDAMMDCALRALDAALAEIRPGASCATPHEAAQKVIDAAGYTEAFRKRIGYSMGIAFAPDWGEGGILSLFTGTDVLLEPGMVFHLPATLRAFGRFTVGASETVIVTEHGCDILSTLPRGITVC